MKKQEIRIDVTDYCEETLRNETVITSKDDIIEHAKNGKSTGEMARSVIASRVLGHAPMDIINSDKMIHHTGARVEVSGIISSESHEVTTKNGHVYESRTYLGKVGRKPTGDDGELPEDKNNYVVAKSNDGYERAINYLDRVVPGHIWNRLLTIYENRGDVERAAASLKNNIDEMVKKLK